MNSINFLQNHQVFITPLSPVHIGCGEGFEISSFIVNDKNNMLFGFDPSKAALTEEQRTSLLSLVRQSNWNRISDFYRNNIDLFKSIATAIVPIDSDIAPNDFDLNKKDDFIAKTAYIRKPDFCEPYLPGSSIKGAIHTAILDRIHDGRRLDRNQQEEYKNLNNLDRAVLRGSMGDSPMRMLSVSDFNITNSSIYTRIITALRLGKLEKFPQKKEGDFKSFFEVVEMAQYRAFNGSINLRQPHESSGVSKKSYRDIEKVVSDLNRFSRIIFKNELDIWERGNPNTREWIGAVRKLLRELNPEMEKGNICFFRIGKNIGAESITLRGEGVSSIQLHKKPAYFSDKTTTHFVAAADQADKSLLFMPFGWVIAEIDPKTENAALKAWCQTTRAKNAFNDFNLSKVKEKHFANLAEVEKRKEKIRKEQEERARERKAQEMLENQKQQEMDALSENLKAVFYLCEELEKAQNARPGTELNAKVFNLLRTAKENWSKDDQKLFAEKLRPLAKAKGMYAGKSEKELKAILRSFEE